VISNILLHEKDPTRYIGSTRFQQNPSRSTDYFTENHMSNYKDPTQKPKKYKIQHITRIKIQPKNTRSTACRWWSERKRRLGDVVLEAADGGRRGRGSAARWSERKRRRCEDALGRRRGDQPQEEDGGRREDAGAGGEGRAGRGGGVEVGWVALPDLI
jgi:hypothetical protein